MKKRPINQAGLFPEQMKPTPEQFTAQLHSKSLIAKSVKRKRPKKGFPNTINVQAEIRKAYETLYKAKGIHVDNLLQYLAGTQNPSAETAMKNKAIVSEEKRTKAGERAIAKSLKTITYFVKRQRKYKEIQKQHAPSQKEYAEKARQKKHLKSM